MPDIFDTLVKEPVDIFDEISPRQTGDIFDRVSKVPEEITPEITDLAYEEYRKTVAPIPGKRVMGYTRESFATQPELVKQWTGLIAKPRTHLQKISEVFKRGQESFNIDRAYTRADLFGEGNVDEIYKQKKLQDTRNQLDPIEGKNLFEKMIYGAAGSVLPSIIEGVKGAVPEMVAGAGTAAIVGQLGPQALLPEETITVPVGIAAGFKVGSAYVWWEQGTGEMLMEMRDTGIRGNIPKIISSAAGIVYARIEQTQWEQLTPNLKTTLKDIINKSLIKFAVQIIKKYGVTVATETAEEVEQRGLAIVAREVAKFFTGHKIAYDKDTLLAYVEELGTTAKEAAISMALMPLPGAIMELSTARQFINPITPKTVPDIVTTSTIKDVINESTDLTDTQKDIGLKYIGDIETRIVNEVVDKFPEPITDQESLERQGNAIKEHLGITQDVKWVWNTRKVKGRMGYYRARAGIITIMGQSEEFTRDVGRFWTRPGVWENVSNKTPGQLNQDLLKKTIVHEIGHPVKPPIIGEVKCQVHHSEFIKWVNENVKKLTEIKEKKVPVARSEAIGPTVGITEEMTKNTTEYFFNKEKPIKTMTMVERIDKNVPQRKITLEEYKDRLLVQEGQQIRVLESQPDVPHELAKMAIIRAKLGEIKLAEEELQSAKTFAKKYKTTSPFIDEAGKTIQEAKQVLAEYPELEKPEKVTEEMPIEEKRVPGEPKPKGLRRRQALIMGHKIPAMLNWTEEQRRAFNKQVTGKESMKDMNLGEVRKVAEGLKLEAEKAGIKYEVPRASEIKDIIDSLVSTISTLGKRKVKGVVTPSNLYPGRLAKTITIIGKKFTNLVDYMDKPEKILEDFDGGKPMSGPFYKTFVEPLNFVADTSVNNNTVTRENLIKFAQDTIGKDKIDDFIFTPKPIVGTDIKLTDVDRIGLGMADIDTTMMQHLTKGNNFTLEQIKAIKNSITEKDKAVWKHTNDWFLEHQTPLLAALSIVEKLGGRVKVNVEQLRKQFMKNYFGLILKDTSTDAQPDFFDVLAQPFEGTKVIIPSKDVIAKRVGSDAPIEINFLKVFLYKSARVERFIQTAPLAAKLAKIMGVKRLRGQINSRTWGRGVKLIEDYIADTIRGSRTVDMEEVDSTLEYMRQAGAAYAIKDNVLSVLRQSFLGGFNTLQQTPRLIPYAIKNTVLYPRFIRINALREFVYSRSAQMKARENLPFTKLKSGDKALVNLLRGKSPIQRGYRGINLADEDAALRAWKNVHDMVMDDTKGNEIEAIKQADYDSRTRQSNPSPQNLPAIFRSKSIGARMLVTFNTEMAPLFNIYKNEIIRAKYRGEIGWGMTSYKILMGHVLPATLMGIISRGRLPKNWKEIATDLIFYAVSPTLFLANFVQQAITGVRTGMVAFAGWDALIAFGQKVVRLGDWEELSEEQRHILLRALVHNATKTIGGFTGLISTQHIRSIEGLFDLITRKTSDWRRLVWSEPALKEPKEKERGISR
jgi:hypothetical protein